ncbi:MAG: type I restriction enzyme HsdR N-terminal domain-containing protein [Crocinitomicaceae bacterium]|nr:type I restriction enzyme HsdR N-terminal domain-containing protein [Crocinitomicaceae bacterium]
MTALNLPEYEFRMDSNEAGITIWDDFRKKHIVCTPEEWVRQNFLRYLVEEKGFPKGLIALEKLIKVNKKNKRFDALVHDSAGEPMLLIEFKAPDVEITEKTFHQIAAYNSQLQVKYLIMSNGIQHFACQVDENGIQFFEEIPEFADLNA